MHLTYIGGLVASAGVWLMATGNRDQCHPMGLWGSGRTLLYIDCSGKHWL